MLFDDLKHKVVLVTGSSAGIGKATAILFAKNGCKVVVTGRNQQRLNEVALKCEEVSLFKYKCVKFAGDLSEDETLKALIEKTIAEYGKLDILVNNAGDGKYSCILDDDFIEGYELLMRVNTRAPLLLSRMALPYLIESKGCIINVSSVSAIRVIPSIMAYSMSKAALDMMTKHLAAEFGPKGVRVNSVNPGYVKTLLHQRSNLPESIYDELSKNQPISRPGESEEIANAICFLASSKSAYTTGACFVIDGGSCLVA
ncbi:tropinone reductase 2-like protein [Dinothrombium tinctorium]|uniref:Tropinone reductase 2-like protein n=1 Tax=Dinothrombium tinctorium TaxID=1965070 RepID=A0A3S3PLN7_9ACAR|nr:tropinone reductase 2-like protein [Dinothrombium tinctorium]RWS09675.1 tropinone reductase 2-like protein [Dinothrombium tinctorium]